MSYPEEVRKRVLALRRRGKTYSEIRSKTRKELGAAVPKSTLSEWFRAVSFSADEKEAAKSNINRRIREGCIKSSAMRRKRREHYFLKIRRQFAYLKDLLKNNDVAKISLAVLYLCEGGKHQSGSLSFGNSDPSIIRLFLRSMRKCYTVDPRKFRCTVQCRADQIPEELESYWSKVTNIPRSQFYRTRIDKRTVGRPTKKVDYKGVCRIDYFSAEIYNQLKIIGALLC